MVPKETNDLSSFQQYSRVRDKYPSIEQSFFTDYDSASYTRMLKRFKSPEYGMYSDLERNMYGKDESHRTFFLRFYLPKRQMRDKNQRIDHIVIMINGLNEVNHFDFYDVLGEKFTEKGVAAVLLPSPFHLNRRLKKEEGRPNDRLAGDRNSVRLFYNYKRSIHEIEALVKLLRQSKEEEAALEVNKTSTDEDFRFYSKLFEDGDNLKISLLGFSLGGLRVLGAFFTEAIKQEENMEQNIASKEIYHSCIVINSGIDLLNIKTKPLKIEPEEWKKIMYDLKLNLKDPEFQKGENKRIFDIFKPMVYDANNDEDDDEGYEAKGKLVKLLADRHHKFLSISSGGDSIVDRDPLRELEEKGKGINRMIIANLDHIPALDPNWQAWYPRVSEMITNFLRDCNEQYWSDQDLTDGIYSLIGETTLFKNFAKRYQNAKEKQLDFDYDFNSSDMIELKSQVHDLCSDGSNSWDNFLSYYFAAKSRFPKFKEILVKICRDVERGRV